MSKYDKMTQGDFTTHLHRVLQDTTAWELLAIPGIYEILSEHFNNDVLDSWREEQELDDDGPTPAFVVHCAKCDCRIDTNNDCFGNVPGMGLMCRECWKLEF